MFLKSLGFTVVEHTLITKNEIVIAVDFYKTKIESLPFLTDGLIIEYDDIAYGKAQGVTGHHSKALFALKHNDDNYPTIFRGVELNTTRTGMSSITSIFDEVDIDGVKVSRASLHNYDIFKALELGVGDTITVYRANSVIPQIEDNLTRSGTYKINMICPSCGSDLVIKTPKVARFLFCENDECPSKLVNRFIHLCSKNALNIDGLSEAGIELFINEGFLQTFNDLYNLERYDYRIKKLDGWGSRSYSKLINAIDNSRKVKCANLIYSLGIPNIGISSSKAIAKHFNDDFQAFVRACVEKYDFSVLTDFGEITNQSIHDWYRNQNETSMWMYLPDEIEIIKEEKKGDNNMKDLTDITFVITGGVDTFKNRDEFKQLVETLNGKVAGSVSNKTNFLVNNDTTSTTGKNLKAKQLNVPVISEVQFNEMIGRI
jgi:DNA ligase (NAD+)